MSGSSSSTASSSKRVARETESGSRSALCTLLRDEVLCHATSPYLPIAMTFLTVKELLRSLILLSTVQSERMHQVGALHAIAKQIIAREFGSHFVRTIEEHSLVFNEHRSLVDILEQFCHASQEKWSFAPEIGALSMRSLLLSLPKFFFLLVCQTF